MGARMLMDLDESVIGRLVPLARQVRCKIRLAWPLRKGSGYESPLLHQTKPAVGDHLGRAVALSHRGKQCRELDDA